MRKINFFTSLTLSIVYLILTIYSIPNVFGNNLDEIARETAQKYKVDVNLICAIINQESSWKQNVVSEKGAIGLMQIMPATGKRFCGLRAKELYNPRKNIDCGVRYFKKQVKRFGGSNKLALCAYNAGPHRVEKYNGCPNFRETQNYQRKILAAVGEGVECPNGTTIRQEKTDTDYRSSYSYSYRPDYISVYSSVKEIADELFLAGNFESKEWWKFVCEAIDMEYYKKFSDPAKTHVQRKTWLKILRATAKEIYLDELRTKGIYRAMSQNSIRNNIIAACYKVEQL